MSTVMVTGGAKRIGAEICQYFAGRGFDVALHCNQSKDAALSLAESIGKQYGVRCEVLVADLKKPQEARDLFGSAIKKFGSIDVLVNNASFFEESSFEGISVENLMDNFNVHYFSPFVLMQEFARQQTLADGLIVNILDCNIGRNQTKYFAYMQAKKALLVLTQNLACSLAPRIRTNAISPGFIIPEENIVADDDYMQRKMRQIPMKTQGGVADIIQAVDYICGAKYVNGQNIYVDGGANLLTI
jgi:NAD(P)-dependent dehydrogenase (short-subunit alcohol dehydrogenase family)